VKFYCVELRLGRTKALARQVDILDNIISVKKKIYSCKITVKIYVLQFDIKYADINF
jgi:hypothetical protein